MRSEKVTRRREEAEALTHLALPSIMAHVRLAWQLIEKQLMHCLGQR